MIAERLSGLDGEYEVDKTHGVIRMEMGDKYLANASHIDSCTEADSMLSSLTTIEQPSVTSHHFRLARDDRERLTFDG